MIKFLIHKSNFDRFIYSIDTDNIEYAWSVVKDKFKNVEYIETI